jgi:CO/xanthine dehydrogenase FAD-binding subunit
MREPKILQPTCISTLVEALGHTTQQSQLIAGGTDLMLHLRQATQLPDVLLDLSGVTELQGIRTEGTRMVIGAMTRFAEIAGNAAVLKSATCLAQAAASVGSMQIRNMATIGGNVANASPCADTVPALLVLQADVGILKSDGSIVRRPLTEILRAASQNLLPHDEVIYDFSFELLAPTARSSFAKLGARSAVTIAKINAALVVEYPGSGEPVSMARAAFGSLASVAFVDEVCSGALVGQPLDAPAADRFAEVATALVDRSIPNRASRPYKRLAIRGIAHDLVAGLN